MKRIPVFIAAAIVVFWVRSASAAVAELRDLKMLFDADCQAGRGHIHGRSPPNRKPIMQQCPSNAVVVAL